MYLFLCVLELGSKATVESILTDQLVACFLQLGSGTSSGNPWGKKPVSWCVANSLGFFSPMFPVRVYVSQLVDQSMTVQLLWVVDDCGQASE